MAASTHVQMGEGDAAGSRHAATHCAILCRNVLLLRVLKAR